MPFIQLNNVKTFYQQTGKGPDVVLVHAFTSNQAVWLLTGIVETLARDFRVTTYDLRGHGASAATESGYDSAQLAADFVAMHESLELLPAWIVGHSYGGVIGAHVATLRPDIVRGVVLSDSYFPGLRHLEPEMGQSAPWRELREMLRECGQDIGERVDFGRLFRTIAALDDSAWEVIKSKLGPPGVRWLSQLAKLAETRAGDEMFDVAGLTADRIAGLAVPVVALYDEHSPFKATCAYLEEHLADVTIDVVPGAKHLAPVQNPAAFTSKVQQHLRRMEGRASAEQSQCGS